MRSRARQKEFTKNFKDCLEREGIGMFAPPPPKLFHYTTADGLQGIIEKDVIWATNYRYVNDLTEFLYANEILKAELLARLPSASPLVHAVLDAILNTRDLLVGAADIFIACFCEEGDLLSQWRAYGGRGGGYAIGYQDIAIRTSLIGSDYRLYKVTYDEPKQREIIRSLLDEFFVAVEELARGWKPPPSSPPVIYSKFEEGHVSIMSGLPEPLGNLCWHLSEAFVRVACCFKSINFACESEWRIVHVRVNEPMGASYDLQFRTSGAILIPYIELPLFTRDHASRTWSGDNKWNFSLEKIVYGPGLNAQATERSIQYLTAKARFPHEIPAEPSKIRVKV